jgi:hypothetical protein
MKSISRRPRLIAEMYAIGLHRNPLNYPAHACGRCIDLAQKTDLPLSPRIRNRDSIPKLRDIEQRDRDDSSTRSSRRVGCRIYG